MTTIISNIHTLILPDPSLPPLTLQLTQMRGSILIFLGTAPGPYSIFNDFACGMTSNGRATSTGVSKSATTSLSLSAKLSKRYSQQVFLSLDLASLVNKTTSIDYILLPMEKALIMKLDSILERK